MSNLQKALTHGLMHGLKAHVRDSYVDGSHSDYRIAEIKGLDFENETVNARCADWNSNYLFEDTKPILFPMSALTKEIEFKGERFVPIEVLQSMNFGWVKIDDGELCCDVHNGMPLSDMSLFLDQLNMWHFNIFNLSPEEYIEVNETNNPYK